MHAIRIQTDTIVSTGENSNTIGSQHLLDLLDYSFLGSALLAALPLIYCAKEVLLISGHPRDVILRNVSD